MKLSKIYLTVILLFISQINSIYANEVGDTWYFYKVSKNTILGGEPTFERERLIYRYFNTKLILSDDQVIVDKVCTFPYKKTLPLLHLFRIGNQQNQRI